MKKMAVVVAALFAALSLHAQVGVLGGFTSSQTKFSGEGFNPSSVSLYHAGVFYRWDIGAGFVLQPALSYQMKGARLQPVAQEEVTRSLNTRTGFAELSCGIQWGLDLMLFRPFIVAEPFVGYAISDNDHWKMLSSGDIDALKDQLNGAKNKLEFGFGVGGGLEIAHHLQVSAQYFMNIGQLFKDDALNTSAAEESVKAAFKGIDNYHGLKITLGVIF